MSQWDMKQGDTAMLLDDLKNHKLDLKAIPAKTLVAALLWHYALNFMNKDNSTVH